MGSTAPIAITKRSHRSTHGDIRAQRLLGPSRSSPAACRLRGLPRPGARSGPGLFKMTVYDSTGRGGHFTDSQPASLFFPENDAKYCKNSCEFRENSAKDCELQQLSAISRNSSKIPWKLYWKIAISVDFRKFVEKICKNHQNLRKSENFEM